MDPDSQQQFELAPQVSESEILPERQRLILETLLKHQIVWPGTFYLGPNGQVECSCGRKLPCENDPDITTTYCRHLAAILDAKDALKGGE
jgi:hypothetical protein